MILTDIQVGDPEKSIYIGKELPVFSPVSLTADTIKKYTER